MLLFDPSPAERSQHPAPSSVPRFANRLDFMLCTWKGRRGFEQGSGGSWCRARAEGFLQLLGAAV